MIIRILGILVGLMFVGSSPFLFDGFDGVQKYLKILGVLTMGVAMIAYGVGGQKLLAKFFPKWASRNGE